MRYLFIFLVAVCVTLSSEASADVFSARGANTHAGFVVE